MTLHDYLSEVEKRAEAADELVCLLSSGERKWTMTVPPQPDDSDMHLIDCVREDIPKLLTIIRAQQEALEKIKGWHCLCEEVFCVNCAAREALAAVEKIVGGE